MAASRIMTRRGLVRLLLAATAITAGFGVSAQDTQDAQASRVLSLGGAVTEIVYALGQGDRLIARDTTSRYPPEAEALPDVGYVRALSPEGVLSVAPDLVLSEEGAGPPEAIDVLQSAQMPFVTVPDALDAKGIAEKIRVVGVALGVKGAAHMLAEDVETRINDARAKAGARAADTPKSVLFILSIQGGRIMASGAGTEADAIIRMAGGVNAIEGITGYKPLSDEAITRAAPDVILMMDRGGDHGMPDAGLLALPPLRTTPAAETKSVVRMNGLYLLGFGPRTAQAITDLSVALYGA